MIGFYNYTVILTYMSLASATVGILTCLRATGHPYIGMFFLLFCGLCDTFDGMVARTKKDRTDREKQFGIQIDSLTDLVAFGVLPGCIGMAMIRASSIFTDIPKLIPKEVGEKLIIYPIICVAIIVFYVLAALIRLAFFNVLEMERMQNAPDSKAYFRGVPVTMSALIFPTIQLIQFFTVADMTPLFFVAMFITSILFVAGFKIPKPGKKVIFILLFIGFVELLLLLLARIFNW